MMAVEDARQGRLLLLFGRDLNADLGAPPNATLDVDPPSQHLRPLLDGVQTEFVSQNLYGFRQIFNQIRRQQCFRGYLAAGIEYVKRTDLHGAELCPEDIGKAAFPGQAFD